MAKVDMHVHSRFSDHPSEWFLQRIGANESYTEPEYVYRTAKECGMDFVTLTDHNTIQGALQLKEHHPDDTFVSVEATTYFPEDGCKIHILVYDLTEEDFSEIQRIRTNIYELRDFIRDRCLAYSVAHATYAVNDRLTADHLAKLILLFDVFEGINGMRARMNSQAWTTVLKSLTPEHIERLYDRHRIEPMSRTPWVKGLTGGSDDHAGLFMGRSYTEGDAATPAQFLEAVRTGIATTGGRHNDYQILAFTFYKIGYEFSRARSDRMSKSLLHEVSSMLFERGKLSLSNRLKLTKVRSFSRSNKESMERRLVDLVDWLSAAHDLPTERKFHAIYDKVAEIADLFFVTFVDQAARSLESADIVSLVRTIATSIPGIFLSMPFFTTLSHMCKGRSTIHELTERLGIPITGPSKRVLWFTDTIDGMNGVSVMLKQLGWLAHRGGRELQIVACLPADQCATPVPPNVTVVPHIHEFGLPHYDTYAVRIPSVLKSLAQIYNFEPDEIFISTPGPVGLLGLLTAWLLKVKITGVYHTDLTEQLARAVGDDSMSNVLDTYTRWFYAQCDEIRVPTSGYMDVLESRGFDRTKMSTMPRGIDGEVFRPIPGARHRVRERYGVPDGLTLCYVGRIARDKSIEFVIDVYEHLRAVRDDVNLLIAGDGPDLGALRMRLARHERVVFTGRIERERLPEIYSAADLLLFPSTTDTFGMAVLEAQACGVPAIVSDEGGPREIIDDGVTGHVLTSYDPNQWVRQIQAFAHMAVRDPKACAAMRTAARANVIARYSWQRVLQELLDNPLAGAIEPGSEAPEKMVMAVA